MVRRRKFLNNFELLKKKRIIQFNVIIDNIYFMENLYKYSTTKRVFLKKKKHFFINYKNHRNLNFFGCHYISLKKKSKIFVLNLASFITKNNLFFFSRVFSYVNKSKLLRKTIAQTDINNNNQLIATNFQFVKLLFLQRQIIIFLLNINYVFRKKNKL